MSGRDAFRGVMRHVHNRGNAPCLQTAFYGQQGILEEVRPLAFASGAIAERLPAGARTVPCAWCGARVSVNEVTAEYASLPQVYVAPERRGRPRGSNLKPIVDGTKEPVSLSQITAATGISQNKLREMCAAGVVPNAFRRLGKSGHWRVPVKSARIFIAQMNDGETGGGNGGDVSRMQPHHETAAF